MRKTVDILGIPVDAVTMDEAVERVGRFLGEGGSHAIFTPNAEIIMQARRDPGLNEILQKADMLTADGAGVVLASRILKNELPEKVSGIDLVQNIFRTYAREGLRVFLFGARPGVAEEAAVNIIKDNPGIVIAGCRNGYFSDEENDEIIAEINRSSPDILLVALGAPKQEKWISANLDKLDVKVCIGVGGTIDVLSGRVRKAPEFLRKNGLEWLYRLCRDPRRAKRMLDLPRFMLRVIRTRLAGSRKLTDGRGSGGSK
jgi:N-acetylglucosaminyldiphosphoundecaprenol N-acetyl-beta-D-mannosaminyltransferase